MTFEEIKEYVLNKSKYGYVKYVFEAGKCTFASLYYTMEETKYLIHKLLNYQFQYIRQISNISYKSYGSEAKKKKIK